MTIYDKNIDTYKMYNKQLKQSQFRSKRASSLNSTKLEQSKIYFGSVFRSSKPIGKQYWPL